MALPKLYANGELEDGTTWEGIRVTLVDKMRFERTARAQKWPPATDISMTFTSFLSYSAAQRAGVLPQTMDWPAFLAVVVDAACKDGEDAPAAEGAEDDSEQGPTLPAQLLS